MRFSDYEGTCYESHLLPIAPANAKLSATSKIPVATLGKIPTILNADGTVVGMAKWQNYSATAMDIQTWDGWEFSIGLRCGGVYIGFDIDAESQEFIDICFEALLVVLGKHVMPLRRRSSSLRCLVVLADGEEDGCRKRALKFINEKTGEEAGLDIQADKAQFVLGPDHPKGKYYWPNGELPDYTYSDLIKVTEDELDQIIKYIIDRVTARGWIVKAGKSLSGQTVDATQVKSQAAANEFEVTSDIEWVAIEKLAFLGSKLCDLIKNGPANGDRSSAAASVVSHLINVGVDDATILNIMLNPSHDIGDKYREKGLDWAKEDVARLRAKFQPVHKSEDSDKIEDDVVTIDAIDELSEDAVRSRIERLERGCSTDQVTPILETLAKINNKLMVENLLGELKRVTGINKGTLVGALNEIRSHGEDGGEGEEALTHHAHAANYLGELNANSRHTVHFADKIHELDKKDNVWKPKSLATVIREICIAYDGLPNMSRNGDYKAVAECYTRLVEDEDFLVSRPHGVAMADGYFYGVDTKGDLVIEPLEAKHKVTWVLPESPDDECHGTEIEAFLHRTFKDNDEQGQIELFWQVVAMIVLGVLTPNQYMALFYGPGATGKSVIAELLEALFPREVVGSVPLHEWGNEYYMAELAGKWLNLLSELSDEKSIEAGPFKQYLDRVAVIARFPAGKPFRFIPQASVVAMTNSLPQFRDKSSASLRRLIGFSCQNVIPEAERDPHYVKKLIAEIPYILHKALSSYSKELKLSDTCLKIRTDISHKSNSVIEFLSDREVFVPNTHSAIPFKTVHTLYKAYCKMASYRAYGRNNFMTILTEVADVQRTLHRDHNPSGAMCLRGFELGNGVVAYLDIVNEVIKPSFSMLKEVGKSTS